MDVFRKAVNKCLVPLALASAVVMPTLAAAQDDYPARPVQVVIGFSAGSSTDVASRIFAEHMGKVLDQRFVVENRPGASSNIATEHVANARPDGYTLLVGTVANTINHSVREGLNFDFQEDFEPVAQIGSLPNLLVVHPSVDADSVDELIALAKEKPGELMYGSAGVATAPHMSGELFGEMAGVDMVHVPYTGTGQAATDLVAGRIDLMFAPASSVVSHIKAGKLKALASTQLERASIAPDLPTIHESGLDGFDTGIWFGLMAPKGTPQTVIDTLADAAREVVQSEEVRATFARYGIEPISDGQEPFAAYIDKEIAKWADVVEKAGVEKQ